VALSVANKAVLIGVFAEVPIFRRKQGFVAWHPVKKNAEFAKKSLHGLTEGL